VSPYEDGNYVTVRVVANILDRMTGRGNTTRKLLRSKLKVFGPELEHICGIRRAPHAPLWEMLRVYHIRRWAHINLEGYARNPDPEESLR
jgi:hypothetical protein